MAPSLVGQTSTTWSSSDDTDFTTGTNWTAGAPADDLVTHVVTFDGTGTVNPVLSASQSVQGLTFTGGAYTLSATNSAALTIGAGAISSTSGDQVIGADVLIGTGSQTWAVSGDTLHLSGNVASANVQSYITKTGTGTLVYSGDVTSSGSSASTTISEGTLQIGNGGTTGSITGNIVNNSALVFNRSNDYSTAKTANISGTGTLTKEGDGTLNLTARSYTYTGQTIISAGTLVFKGTFETSSIVNNGALAYDNRASMSYDGIISGSGTFTKWGTSVMTFSAANTFSGATIVSFGTLTLSHALALQNSALDTSGSGVITLSSVTTPTLGGLIGSTDLASVITSGYSGVTNLTLNPGTDASNTYSGVIADGATGMTLTKTGAGTQILSGTNTYTGATTVSAGTLSVNGSLAADSTVTVASGGTLGGSGTINGATTIQSGGTLAPGNSPGLLTFTDGLTLDSGSTSQFQIEGIDRGVSYDAIDVTGGILTYGGALTLNFSSTITSGTTLDLFDLTNAAEGSFSSIGATGSYVGSFASSGGTWTLSSGGQTLTFVQSTGDLSVAASSAVPEPGTYALIFGGVALGLAASRRRQHRT